MTHSTPIDSSYDAVVVGARVAGASTAMLLARAGRRVLVVDRGIQGSDTTSTHALMRAGIMQLHRWGVLDRVTSACIPAIRKTTFHYGDETIDVAIKPRDGVDAFYAPRRTVLDAALCEAARDSGAQVVHRTAVDSLLRDADGRVTGVDLRDSDGVWHRVRAGIVIGADGAGSLVARETGAAVLRTGSRPCAVVYGYWHGLDIDGTHWYYNHDVAAGAIPTNDGLTCVFAAMRPARYEATDPSRFATLFSTVLTETNPRLAEDVARATRTGKLHPFAGRPGFIRQSWGPGWALVGDAGCFKDPLTAHGMTDALRDAEFLARAVIDGSDEALAGYQAERDAFAVEFLDLSDEIASFDWDLERVKQLHHGLSKLMTRECDRVREWDGVPSIAAGR